jgi:hypothetical protein
LQRDFDITSFSFHHDLWKNATKLSILTSLATHPHDKNTVNVFFQRHQIVTKIELEKEQGKQEVKQEVKLKNKMKRRMKEHRKLEPIENSRHHNY